MILASIESVFFIARPLVITRNNDCYSPKDEHFSPNHKILFDNDLTFNIVQGFNCTLCEDQNHVAFQEVQGLWPLVLRRYFS